MIDSKIIAISIFHKNKKLCFCVFYDDDSCSYFYLSEKLKQEFFEFASHVYSSCKRNYENIFLSLFNSLN